MLERLFADFEIVSTDVDETSDALPLEKRATELAVAKAAAVWTMEAIVIAADTIVGMGNLALGKPQDSDQAKEMLAKLSGRRHRVITGVALRWPEGETAFHDVTEVEFRDLREAEIAAYVETQEPMDKAGAYAIQGGAAGFATTIDGDIDTVIGLPITQLAWRLQALGLASTME